jgi:hypothetical protein
VVWLRYTLERLVLAEGLPCGLRVPRGSHGKGLLGEERGCCLKREQRLVEGVLNLLDRVGAVSDRAFAMVAALKIPADHADENVAKPSN